MRCQTVSQAKGLPAPRRNEPSAGSRIRMFYDMLMVERGRPVALNLNPHGDGRLLIALQDFYGLDIRHVQRGNKRRGIEAKYVLAGEWFGRVYVDYIAEHLASLEQRSAA